MFDRRDEQPGMRRPLMFQVDHINEKKRSIERNKMFVENPVGGAFKVSNGKYLCEVILSDYGVQVKCRDKNGRAETIHTRNMFL